MSTLELPLHRLMGFFTVLFVLISGMLVYWQVGQTQALADSPYRICIHNEQAVRGRIYDRKGELLAWSEEDKRAPCGWRRRYATAKHPSISSFLGYFSYPYGATGIEKYYNDVLNGSVDPQNFDNAAQQFWNRTLHQTVYGADIYLSIDIRIQDQLEHFFPDQVTGGACTEGTNKGSIIVENPQTGELLAVLSKPYYNGDTIGDPTPAADNLSLTVGQEYWNAINADTQGTPLFNRALQGQYQPGSTFKTLTLMAALDSGQYTIHSGYDEGEATKYVVNGHTFDANNLSDYKDGPEPPTFPLDLAHAYAYSDNVVFARVGVALGPQRYLDYARRFALSTPDLRQNVPVDYSPTTRSSIYTSQNLDDPVNLGATAYGQGQLAVSPLTMAMVTGAVANDGRLAPPHFLRKIVPHDVIDPSTVGDYDFGPPDQVVAPGVAQAIRQAMRAVVTYGSVGASGGTIAAIGRSTAQIGAKTGSAQIGDGGNSHAWFLALAPDTNAPARLTTVIMKERAGAGACQAPIARDIFEFALPLLG